VPRAGGATFSFLIGRDCFPDPAVRFPPTRCARTSQGRPPLRRLPVVAEHRSAMTGSSLTGRAPCDAHHGRGDNRRSERGVVVRRSDCNSNGPRPAAIGQAGPGRAASICPAVERHPRPRGEHPNSAPCEGARQFPCQLWGCPELGVYRPSLPPTAIDVRDPKQASCRCATLALRGSALPGASETDLDQ